MAKKYKYTTARQVGGDDGYCYAVFVKGEARPRVTGLTRSEVPYYRDRFEKEHGAKVEAAKVQFEKDAAKGLPYRSLSDLYERAQAGDVLAQKVCIGALSNLGCDHLADNSPMFKDRPKWVRYWRGFTTYLESLVGEYGLDEGAAEKELLAEINAARDYSDGVQLEG